MRDDSYIRVMGPSPTRVSEELPSGAGECNCGNCREGITMPASSTVCCDSHPSWDFVDPWLGGLKTLNWSTGNVWLTDAFTGPSCGSFSNEYKWRLTVSATTGSTILEIVTETDNGCDETCISYVTAIPLRCLCDNELVLKSWDNVDRGELACVVCVKPRPLDADCSSCADRPIAWSIDLSGFSDSQACDDSFNSAQGNCDGICSWIASLGTVTLTPLEPQCGIPGDCSWRFSRQIPDSVCDNPRSWFRISQQSHYLQMAVGHEGSPFLPTLTLCSIPGGGDYGATALFADQNAYDAITCADAFTATGFGSVSGVPSSLTVTPVGSATAPTSDGSCAGCTTPAAPADAAGSCCVQGQCLDTSQADCTSLAGEWFTTDAACESGCDYGACCWCGPSDEFYCVDNMSPEFCSGSGVGIPSVHYPGQDCTDIPNCAMTSEVPCTPSVALGACCTLGVCEDAVAYADCMGDWTSGGTCAEVTCDPVGCCESFVSSPCADNYTEAECDAESGTWCEGGTCGGGGCSCP